MQVIPHPKFTQMKLSLSFLGLLLFSGAFANANAGDIAEDVRSNNSGPVSKNGGFLEFGVTTSLERRIEAEIDDSVNDVQLNIGLSLSAGYRYNRMFIEASESGFDGLNMGLTLLETDTWSVDMLLANIAGHISIDSDDPPPPTTENERNRAILDRNSLSVAAGSRITGYFGDNIVQLRLVSDWYDGNGIFGSARVGRHWQLGNWNAQAIAGFRYNSANFNNYLYGVTEEEQSQRFNQYSAGSAIIPEIELGASLPVKENWVYSARLRYRHYPSSVTNSPLVEEESDIILSSGIYYVF